MTFFPKTYFVRSHLLLAALGSISLLSFASFSMDDGDDPASLQRRASHSSQREIINLELEIKIQTSLIFFQNKQSEEEPTTTAQKKKKRASNKQEKIDLLSFLETIIERRDEISLETWLNTMKFLVEHGNQDQKTRGSDALITLIKAFRDNTDENSERFEVLEFLNEKGSLTPSQKENLEIILRESIAQDFPFKNKVEMAMAHFMLFPEQRKEISPFLGEALRNPQWPKAIDRLGYLGFLMSNGCKDVKDPKSLLKSLIAEKFRDCNILKADVFCDPIRVFFEMIPNWAEIAPSLFREIAEDSGGEFLPKVRVVAALQLMRESREHAVPILRSLVKDSESLPPEDRVKTLQKMMGYWFNEKKEFLDGFVSVMENFRADIALKTAIGAGESFQTSTHRQSMCSLFLFKSEEVDAQQEDIIKALKYVVQYGLEEQKEVAGLNLLGRIENLTDHFFWDGFDILETIAYWGTVSQREKACEAFLKNLETKTYYFDLRFRILNTILNQGTLPQREKAWTIERSKEATFKERLRILEKLVRCGTPDQKKEAFSILQKSLEDKALSFQERIDGLKIIIQYGDTDDQKKEAGTALFEFFQNPDRPLDFSWETVVELFFLHGDEALKKQACSHLLSITEFHHKGSKPLSLGEHLKIESFIYKYGSETQKERSNSVLISFITKSKTLSLAERIENLKGIIQNPTENNKQACQALIEVLTKQHTPLKDSLDVFSIIKKYGTEPQKKRMVDILFSLFETSQSLSEDEKINLASQIIDSVTEEQKEEICSHLISILRKSKKKLDDDRSIPYFLASNGTPQQIELSCDILLSFDQDEYWERYIFQNGTQAQKERLCRKILLSLNSVLALSDIMDKATDVIWNGTPEQEKLVLCSLFENSKISFDEWQRFSNYYEDKEKQQREQLEEALLLIIENSEAPITLEKRIGAAWRISRSNHEINTNRAYGVLISIIENPDSLPEEERRKLLETILSSHLINATLKRRVAPILLSFSTEGGTPFDRMKSAARLVERELLTSVELQESVEKVLVDSLEIGEIPLSDRINVAEIVLQRGRSPQKKDCASTFLFSHLEDPTSSFSQEERIRHAKNITIYGNPRQQERAGNFLLGDEITPEMFPYIGSYIETLSNIIGRNIPAQKEKACLRLLSFSSKDSSTLEIVAGCGTEEQKKEACHSLLSLFQTSSKSVQYRLPLLLRVLKNGDSDQKTHANSLFYTFAENSKNWKSLNERVEGIVKFYPMLTISYKEKLDSLLNSFVENPSLFSSLEERVEIIHKIMYDFNSNLPLKTQLRSLLLSLCENHHLWSSFGERLKTVEKIVQVGTSIEKERAQTLLFSMIQDFENSMSLDDRINKSQLCLRYGSQIQKETVVKFLCDLSARSTLSNRMKIAEILMASRAYAKLSKDQFESVSNIFLEALQSSELNLSSKERLEIAGKVFSLDSSEQKTQACSILVSFVESLNLENQIKAFQHIVYYGTPDQWKSAHDRLFSIFTDPKTSLECFQNILDIISQDVKDTDHQLKNQMLHLIQDPKQSFSIEKRLAGARAMIRHDRDPLLSIIENFEVSPKERREILEYLFKFFSRDNLQYTIRGDVQYKRMWMMLEKILTDPSTKLEDLRKAGILFVKHRFPSSSEMSTGTADQLLKLMNDSDILLDNHSYPYLSKESIRQISLEVRSNIALFLMHHGETEEQKELASDFLSDHMFQIPLSMRQNVASSLLNLKIPRHRVRALMCLLNLDLKEDRWKLLETKFMAQEERLRSIEEKPVLQIIQTLINQSQEDWEQSLEAALVAEEKSALSQAIDKQMEDLRVQFRSHSAERDQACIALFQVADKLNSPEKCYNVARFILENRTSSDLQKEEAVNLLLRHIRQMSSQMSSDVARFVVSHSKNHRQKLIAFLILANVNKIGEERWELLKTTLLQRAEGFSNFLTEQTAVISTIRRLADHPPEQWPEMIEKFFTEMKIDQLFREVNSYNSGKAIAELLDMAENPQISKEISIFIAEKITKRATGAQKERACDILLHHIEEESSLTHQGAEIARCVTEQGNHHQKLRALIILAGTDGSFKTALEKILLSKEEKIRDVSDDRIIEIIQRIVSENIDTWGKTLDDLFKEEQIIATMHAFPNGSQDISAATDFLIQVVEDAQTSMERRLHIVRTFEKFQTVVSPDQKRRVSDLLLQHISHMNQQEKEVAARLVSCLGDHRQKMTAFIILSNLDLSVQKNQLLERILYLKADQFAGISEEKMIKTIITLAKESQDKWGKIIEEVLIRERIKPLMGILENGSPHQRGHALEDLLSIAENPEFSSEIRVDLAKKVLGTTRSEEQRKRACNVLLPMTVDLEISNDGRFDFAKIILEAGSPAQKEKVCAVLLEMIERHHISREASFDIAKTIAGKGSIGQKEQACAFILKDIPQRSYQEKQNAAQIVFSSGNPHQKIRASVILSNLSGNPEKIEKIERTLLERATELVHGSDKKMTKMIESLFENPEGEWSALIEKAFAWEPNVSIVKLSGEILTTLYNTLGAPPSINQMKEALHNTFTDLTDFQLESILKDLNMMDD